MIDFKIVGVSYFLSWILFGVIVAPITKFVGSWKIGYSISYITSWLAMFIFVWINDHLIQKQNKNPEYLTE